MPTPIFICGAECNQLVIGTAGPAGTTRHWASSNAAAITVVTSGPSPMRSTRCYRFNPSAQAANLAHSYATAIASPATMVARFYIYFATLPSSTCSLLTNQLAYGAYFNASDNKIYAGSSTSALGATGVSVTTGVWYCVDVKTVMNATRTADVNVDGVACGQRSLASSASNDTTVWLGNQATTTGDYYIDDVTVSQTSGDFPLSGGTVAGLYPTADGSHNYNAASDFLVGASTNLGTGATTAYTHLQNPLTTTIGDFLAAANEATSEYLRFLFEDLPASANAVWGVAVVTTNHSATATGNAVDVLVVDNSATSGTTVVVEKAHLGGWSGGVFTTGVDLSETSIVVCYTVATSGASTGAWTKTNVNDLAAIFGATDVTPDDYLDGICLEVAITTDATASAVVVTPTATIPAASASSSSPDGTGSAVNQARTTTIPAVTGSTANTAPVVTPTTTTPSPTGSTANTVAAVARTTTIPAVTGTGDAVASAVAVVATASASAVTGSTANTVTSVAGTMTIPAATASGTSVDPANLAVNVVGSTATLTWDASGSANVVSYEVYRRTPSTGAAFTPGSDTPIAAGVTDLSYSDTGLGSATYDWQVFAVTMT